MEGTLIIKAGDALSGTKHLISNSTASVRLDVDFANPVQSSL
jgi:hypothetical protein